jgi:hypothetical protein
MSEINTKLLNTIFLPRYVLEQITEKEKQQLKKILNKEYELDSTYRYCGEYKFYGIERIIDSRSSKYNHSIGSMDYTMLFFFSKMLDEYDKANELRKLKDENEILQKELKIIKDAVKIITKEIK